jgi:hypothetical protein
LIQVKMKKLKKPPGTRDAPEDIYNKYAIKV